MDSAPWIYLVSTYYKRSYRLRGPKLVYLKRRGSFVLQNTRWFKYDRDYLCVNKSQFVPVIFEPPCMLQHGQQNSKAQQHNQTFPICVLHTYCSTRVPSIWASILVCAQFSCLFFCHICTMSTSFPFLTSNVDKS
jgi:hypothetical protein